MLIAQLGMRIDSEDASGAAADLDKLTAAGGRAQKATEQLAGSAKKANEALGKQRDELADLLGEIDPTVKALGRLDELEKRLAQQRKLGSLDAATFSDYQGKIAQSRESLTRFDDSLTRTGNTAKQTAAALRGVPAQFTDIVVSLQAGQQPLQVLLQQGGQLKDMFGGIGPAASALGGYVLGLVNPFTVAAAAAAVLTLAYYQGSQEAENYEKALILSGNAAGTTADQLAETAKHISNVVGTTAQASAALVLMAQSGKIAAENMEQIGVSAVSFSKATGTAIEDVVAQYVSLGKEPVEASRKLNEQYGYLTAAVYQQIAALEAQGEREQAAALAQTALADAQDQMASRVQQGLGSLQRGWNSLASAAKGAWDAMLGIGREETLQTRIDKLSSFIDKRSKLGGYDNTDYERQLEALKAQLATEQQRSKEQGEQRKQNADAIEAVTKVKAITDATLTNEQKRTKEKKEYLTWIEKIRKADPDSDLVSKANVDKVLANIDDKYKDPKTRTRTRRSAVDLTDLNDEQNARKALVSSYANSQKELEAQQKAGLITQEAYYRQRVVLINAEKEQVTAAYQGEINALEQAKARSTTSAEQRIQLDQKIADARANMVKAQEEAGSKLKVLATEEDGRIRQQTAAVSAYVDQLERERRARAAVGDRAAAALGMGDREASLQSELDGVTDSFNKKRDDLLDRRRTAPDKYSQADYERDLQILESAENKYRDTVLSNYDKMSEAQSDWRSGVSSGVKSYIESAQNLAGQTKSLVTGAFSNMEDAVVNFAKTGKLSFKDLADGIISDMIRIQVRQAAVGALSYLSGGGLGSLFSSGASGSAAAGASQSGYTSAAFSSYVAGQRAVGGPVGSNSLYQVNELGPELLSQGGKTYLMTGAQGGSITPLGRPGESGTLIANTPGVALGGGNTGAEIKISAPQQVFHINGDVSPQTVQMIQNAGQQAYAQAMRDIQKDIMRNGPLTRGMRAAIVGR